MKVKLMSLGLEITPAIKQANETIEKFVTKYYKSDEKFNQFNSEKSFITNLSKAVKNDDVIVLAAEPNLYGPFKSFIAKAFNLNKKRNKIISYSLKETCPEIKTDLKVYKSHVTIPSGAVPLVSEDGKYSGFVIKSNKKIVLVLPLDAQRLEHILDVSFVEYLEENFPKIIEASKNINEVPAYDDKMIKQAIDLMSKNQSIVSVAATKTVDFLGEINNKVVDISKVAIQSDYSEVKGERPPREYAINLAKGAKNQLNASLGAAITNVFTLEKSNGEPEMFLYVCVADENEANALKMFAKKGETVPHFILSAINEMFLMISSWANTGSIFPPVEQKLIKKTEKQLKIEDNKYSFKTKVIVSTLLVLSLVASVLVVFLLDDVYNLRGSLAKKAGASTCSYSSIANTEKASAKSEDDKEDDGHGGLDIDAVFIDDLTENEKDEKKDSEVEVTKKTTATKKTTKPQTTKKPTTTKKPNTTKKPAGPYPATLVLRGQNVETAQAIGRIVQAEMGSSFHKEALKAQAVAVFTYIKNNNWKISGVSSKSYCSSTVLNAVNSVLGKTVTCNGRPALTSFFAMSAGKTVPSNTVWNNSHRISYLAGGVVSPEGSTLSSYKTVRTYSSTDIKSRIESNLGVTLTGAPNTWIKINSHDGCVNSTTGYISSMTVGGKTINGHNFRASVMKYAIRSHCFNLSYDQGTDKFTFTVYGYGHGIGMSQCGANYYAKQGWNYVRILTHYYIGTVVK